MERSILEWYYWFNLLHIYICVCSLAFDNMMFLRGSSEFFLAMFQLFQVSMIGVHYLDDHVATGFGNHLARPLLREEWKENLTFEEGVKLLEKCMRVLLYRDRSAVNKIRVSFLSL